MEEDATRGTMSANKEISGDITAVTEKNKETKASAVSANQPYMDSLDGSISAETSCNEHDANHLPIQVQGNEEFKESASQRHVEGRAESLISDSTRDECSTAENVGGSAVDSPAGKTACLLARGGESLVTHSSHEALSRVGSTEEMERNEEGDKKIPTADSSESYDDLRKALVVFYSVHNPSKIATLDVILTQYRGKEDVLVNSLEQKYSADLSYARRAVLAPKPKADAMTTDSLGSTTPEEGGALQSKAEDASPIQGEEPPQVHMVPQDTRALQPVTDVFSHDLSNADGRSGSALSVGPDAPQVPRSIPGNSSASYMTYLADQIRSNMEGLLPGSSGVVVPSSTGPSLVSAAVSPSSATARWQRRDPRAIFPSTSMGTAGSLDGTHFNHRTIDSRTGRPVGGSTEDSGSVRNVSSMHHTAPGVGQTRSSPPSSIRGEVEATKVRSQKSAEPSAENTVDVQRERADAALARVALLEDERGQLLARCKRLQGKAEAASREAAAAEELREAGQRKLTAFAERAAAAERQARDTAIRLRVLESGQVALQAEKEAFGRRCAAKHQQLISAIDLQLSLRSQLEALLGVPPLFASIIQGEETLPCLPRSSELPVDAGVDAIKCDTPITGDQTKGGMTTCVGRDGGVTALKEKDAEISVDSGGGDKVGGRGVDELKRRCSMLEVCLKASKRECSDALRARDAAEDLIREQQSALVTLRAKVSELEATIAREAQAGKEAAQAAHSLEGELALQLGHLREEEAKVCDQTEENRRLREELRGATARLRIASDARAALLRFCQQERSAVELDAAQHVTGVEENAVMRGEEGLARGLELARIAEEAGEKRAAAAAEEADRLGKALFTARAELAGCEAREQALRTELTRAAETIATLSSNAVPPPLEEKECLSAATGAKHGDENAHGNRTSGSRTGPRSRISTDSSRVSPGSRLRSRAIMRAAPKEAEVDTSAAVASSRRRSHGRTLSDGQHEYDVEL